MSRFKIVIVSKDENFAMDKQSLDSIQQSLLTDKSETSFDASLVTNKDKQNLTTVYNKFLEEVRVEKNYDFIVFMHADVKLNVKSFLQHIEDCKDKYDVFGLCGTQKLNTNVTPLNWFAGSNKYQFYRIGKVCHGQLDDQVSYFNADRPYITDAEVACIDGLCIVFGKQAIKSNLKFDEQLTFNCYDTQISLDAILNHNLKLGVIVEDSLQHFSIGLQIINKELFQKDEIRLRDYFKLKPIDEIIKQNIQEAHK